MSNIYVDNFDKIQWNESSIYNICTLLYTCWYVDVFKNDDQQPKICFIDNNNINPMIMMINSIINNLIWYVGI